VSRNAWFIVPLLSAMGGATVAGGCAPVILPGGPFGDSGPGSLPADAGPGCSDGTREGFVSMSQYPSIAACAGAWSVPGITAAGASQGPVVPTCNLNAGNDSNNVNGTGCSAADLCAAGWHICRGSQEVTARSATGCADAVPATVPNDNGSNYVLFAVAQHSLSGSICDDTSGNDNDIFGCGAFGQQLQAANDCGPLNQTLASTVANSCGYSQAIPPNGPWQCQGSNSLNEGDFVAKDGCPNKSCNEGGYTYGSSDKGGVLCCQDP
jgi:hypothetical protein